MIAFTRILTLLFLTLCLRVATMQAGSDEDAPADSRDLAIARDLLHQAKQLFDEHDESKSMGEIRYAPDLVKALAELGDHDAAEAMARHVPVHGLGALAIGYARGGDMERVRQTIARILTDGPNDGSRNELLWLEVGQALAGSGHAEQAVEAFAAAVDALPKTTTDRWSTIDVLLKVAEGWHGLGRLDETSTALTAAVDCATGEPDGSNRNWRLSEIAAMQAQLDYLPQSLATVERLSEPEERNWTWYKIVEAETKAGRLEDAYRVAEKIDGNLVPRTWMALARGEVAQGRLPEARKALRKAEDATSRLDGVEYRLSTMVMLAPALAAAGDRNAAAGWLKQAVGLAGGPIPLPRIGLGVRARIERVPGSAARQFHLREIATAQAKLGLKDEAKRTFEQAKIAARGEQPGMWSDTALLCVAKSQAEAGLPDDALATVATLPEDSFLYPCYVSILGAMVRAGDPDGAFRVANHRCGSPERANGDVARALLKAGDPGTALRIGLEAEGSVDVLLHDAARQLAASGQAAIVTQAVPQAKYGEDRVPLLIGAAEGLMDRVRAAPKPVKIAK